MGIKIKAFFTKELEEKFSNIEKEFESFKNDVVSKFDEISKKLDDNEKNISDISNLISELDLTTVDFPKKEKILSFIDNQVNSESSSTKNSFDEIVNTKREQEDELSEVKNQIKKLKEIVNRLNDKIENIEETQKSIIRDLQDKLTSQNTKLTKSKEIIKAAKDIEKAKKEIENIKSKFSAQINEINNSIGEFETFKDSDLKYLKENILKLEKELKETQDSLSDSDIPQMKITSLESSIRQHRYDLDSKWKKALLNLKTEFGNHKRNFDYLNKKITDQNNDLDVIKSSNISYIEIANAVTEVKSIINKEQVKRLTEFKNMLAKVEADEIKTLEEKISNIEKAIRELSVKINNAKTKTLQKPVENVNSQNSHLNQSTRSNTNTAFLQNNTTKSYEQSKTDSNYKPSPVSITNSYGSSNSGLQNSPTTTIPTKPAYTDKWTLYKNVNVCPKMSVQERLDKLKDTRSVDEFLKNSSLQEDDAIIKNFNSYKEELSRIKLKNTDDSIEKDLENILSVICKFLLKKIFVSISRSICEKSTISSLEKKTQEKVLETLNKYLEENYFYTKQEEIKVGDILNDNQMMLTEQLTDKTAEGRKKQILSIELYPYYINYFDEDEEQQVLHTNGSLIVKA